MNQSGQLLGEALLRIPILRILLVLEHDILYLAELIESEQFQQSLHITVFDPNEVLVEAVGARLLWVQPERVTR